MDNPGDTQSDDEPYSSAESRLSGTEYGNLSVMVSGTSLRFSENSESTTGSSESQGDTTTFDKTLAARHEYLGSDLEELRGITLHDEGSILGLPILLELGVVLVPGQTLPLTAFYPPTVSMLREVISKDKTFGVVCVRSVPNQRKALAKFGTTAEIFQYQEDGDLVGFKIKAKGRQRFKLLEQERNRPGILTGKVLILPEVSLLSPLNAARFTSLDRYRHSPTGKISGWDASVTPWPEWVYRQYDPQQLVTRVLQELKNFKLDISSSALPTDPVDLSYWAAQCLPVDDIHRVGMLSLNTAVERLQYALILLAKCQKLYCTHCGNNVADRKDVYSMSVEGPQGTYCNPGGHVHEILTLYKATGMNLALEEPTAEYSWFPGYGWTIASCAHCYKHMGWLFTAMRNDLKPVKFWGLSRRSVTTHHRDIDSDFDPEEYIYSRVFYGRKIEKWKGGRQLTGVPQGSGRWAWPQRTCSVGKVVTEFDFKGALPSKVVQKSYNTNFTRCFSNIKTDKIASCEAQGPSGSKHGSSKGTPARKSKSAEKGKQRKNSSQGPTPSSQATRGGLRVYKVVVLGDGGVGKSALTLQFVSHSFSEYHDPTIEDAYQQQAVIDGEAALLDILDTAGQVEFNAMRDQYMRCGEGFIICYSVTDRHSFQEAVEYKKLINKVRASEDIPIVLIGNKFDLQHQRKVTLEEGQALAQQFGCPFFETSAALRHFVDDAFHTLIREIRAKGSGRNSSNKARNSKWKRIRSIFSIIFKKKNNCS